MSVENPEYKPHRELGLTEEEWIDLKAVIFNYLKDNSSRPSIPEAELRALDAQLSDDRNWAQMLSEIDKARIDIGAPATEASLRSLSKGRKVQQKKFDLLTGSFIYIGFADSGVAQSEKTWTIKRVTLDSNGNPIDEEWTAEHSASWDARASETYK